MLSFNPFARVQNLYEDIWKAIIRPTRGYYELEELGATRFTLRESGRSYQRTDFEVLNTRAEKLKCSHYEHVDSQRPSEKLPCVIYLHGNCSCRLEATSILPFLLPLNITVVGFDFSGSGLSDGEWVTLGWREKDDLACVIDFLRESRRISTVALWGRSMGAVTAILHSQVDATVMGIVCDSPFSNFKRLAEEVAQDIFPLPLPEWVVAQILRMLQNTMKAKCGFDMNCLDISAAARSCTVPVLFVTGDQDTFIRSHHSTELLTNYGAGDKWLIRASGDHNSARSNRVMGTQAVFLYNALQCTTLFEAAGVDERYLRMWRRIEKDPGNYTLFPSANLAEVHDMIIVETDPTVTVDTEKQMTAEETMQRRKQSFTGDRPPPPPSARHVGLNEDALLHMQMPESQPEVVRIQEFVDEPPDSPHGSSVD